MTALQIHPKDNVAVQLTEDGSVPRGHKVALSAIKAGEKIIKYGEVIGSASQDIAEGEWVHSHNLKTELEGHLDYRYDGIPVPPAPVADAATFRGYLRHDGRVGVRNRLFVVPTVGCVNALSIRLAAAINRELPAEADTAVALIHPYGCSQLGEDHETTAETLAALCCHPNAGGVLVVALGCENNTLESFQKRLAGKIDPNRVRFLPAQQEEDEFEAGLAHLRDLAKVCSLDRRTSQPLSKLVIGLKCGGSDGLSGITANPLVGRFTDFLTQRGGSTILSEVPEMFGAERGLMRRAASREVFDQCVTMIDRFKEYFIAHGQPIGENPSPGNKEGGITTLEEKSLGCTQKSGSALVTGVLNAGERIQTPGLHLLYGPGNDLVASTLLAAAGAQIILFTTGRGTPFGSIVPTLKIATNTPLAEHKKGWIDFDAGRVLSGSREALDKEFRELVLATADGRKAQNETHFCEEIALFKNGVTL